MSRAWALRALLAALLAFASEAVLWTTAHTRPPFEWLVLALAYPALAALLLDLAARWRLRDLFGLLALAGVYGLLNAALLNPEAAFADFPRTLFTRALGGQALMGLIALAWWLRLTDPRARPFTIGYAGIALAIGLVGGFWARWSPGVFVGGDETPLLSIGVVYSLLALLTWVAAQRIPASDPPPDLASLRLGRAGGAFVAVTLVAVGGAQIAAGRLDGVQITTVALFALFCAGVVWFQRRKTGATLLDGRTRPASPRAMLLLHAIGGAGVIIGALLPRGAEGDTDPLALIAVLLTAYGLVWLPMVAFVLGAREFTRLSRAMRL